jgi:chromosomal replication initiation ATPase DnaA
VPTNTRNFDKGSKAKHQSGAISENARRFFQVSLSDLKSNQRAQYIAFLPTAHHVFVSQITGSSLAAMDAHFERDHSTVIHVSVRIATKIEMTQHFDVDQKDRVRLPPGDPEIAAIAGSSFRESRTPLRTLINVLRPT